MPLSSRLSNGWDIMMSSFQVLKRNKQLLLFPILSGISMMVVLGSFILVLAGTGSVNEFHVHDLKQPSGIAVLFLFYLVNYFVVVFFNMALIHCTKLYFEGEPVSLKAGIQFSLSRLGVIFSWAVVAATVGTILKLIQENLGSIGKIIIGLIGVVWSILTFFVVPVIAYENVGPFKAIERSRQIVAEKWGEGIGAGFSFGFAYLLGLLAVGVLFVLGWAINPLLGGVLAALGVLLLAAVMSAARTIFVSAIYHNVTGDIDTHLDQQLVDSLFVPKK